MKDSALVPSTSNQVSLAPSPAALVESLRSIGYTVETALADVIDNSISAGAARISIRFQWSEGNAWVAVLDDGCGMSADELREAMRFGTQSPLLERAKHDLGRFGLGLKTASISQCRRMTVCSKSENSISACEWDLDYLTDEAAAGDWMLKVLNDEERQNDEMLAGLCGDFLDDLPSGTAVIWRGMDAMLAGTERIDSERKFSELMSHAREHLETVFHRFLSPDPGQKAVRIDFNNSQLTAFNPFGPNIPARRELPVEKVSVNGEPIEVQPYILPHQNKVSRSDYDKYAGEGGYLQNQGFYVYRNRRLIVKATWFRLMKKEELNKLVRVRIDIPNSLDHIWAINVDKSQVTPPEIVRKQLKNIIQRISGAGKQVYKRKAARIINRNIVPVWSREISEGKISYSVNLDHPLLSEPLEQLKPELRKRIATAFSIIAQSFPTDVFYTDKANDDLEVSLGEFEESAAVELCRELIQAFLQCGLTPKDIRAKLLATEIPGASPAMIEKLLNEGPQNG